MKSKFMKLFLGTSAVALTTITLSSCASTKTTQYGIYSLVKSDSPSNEDSNADRQKTFSGFYFNNFGYSTSSTLYAESTEGNYASLSNSYSSAAWSGVVFPLLNYIKYLSDLYTLGFKKDSNDWKSDIITLDSSNSSKSSLLNQFIYSWANVVSKGKKSLKFGIVRVGLKFNTSITDASTNNVFPVKDSQLKYDKDKSTATFESTTSFQIAVKLGYWNSAQNNPKQGLASEDTIKKDVESTGSWDSSLVTTNEMYLVLNYSNVKLNLTYSKSDISKYDESVTFDSDSITWTDKLNSSSIVPTFTFSGTNSSNDTLPSSIDNTSVNSSIVSIGNILNSSSFDSEKVNSEKAKYSKSLTLSDTAPSNFKDKEDASLFS